MLADITRHSRFTKEEFRVLSTGEPIDIPQLHKTIRAMLDEAGQFIQSLPTSAIGVIFLENGKPVQPDPSRLGTYQTLSGSIGGIWPSSPQISSSMLQAYRNNNPQ
jgi:hypothetical protein